MINNDQYDDGGNSPSNYQGINNQLNDTLENPIITPQSGMQRVRNILSRYGIDMPIVFDMDDDGDEYAFKVGDHYLYFIYGKMENDLYEAYSEISDESRLSELMDDSDEEETD
jgi:hypothetical protein